MMERAPLRDAFGALRRTERETAPAFAPPPAGSSRRARPTVFAWLGVGACVIVAVAAGLRVRSGVMTQDALVPAVVPAADVISWSAPTDVLLRTETLVAPGPSGFVIIDGESP
jgi:hypothetical protein